MGKLEQLLLQEHYDEGQLAQALLDHCYAPLHYLAYSLLDDAEEGDDIVQETLLVALGKIDQYQPGADLKAWLSRTAIYRCRDVIILALAGWYLVQPYLETNTVSPETADEAVAALATEPAELPAVIPPTATAVPPTSEPPPTAVPSEEPTQEPTAEPTATNAPPTMTPEPVPDMALWSKHAPIPAGRYDRAASAVDGIIYVLGGFGGPQRVDAYDPE